MKSVNDEGSLGEKSKKQEITDFESEETSLLLQMDSHPTFLLKKHCRTQVVSVTGRPIS